MKYVLSEDARWDLADILEYTGEKWGLRQVDIYAHKILKTIREIARTPYHLRSKTREDLFPGCRTINVEKHIIIYRVLPDRVEIARILGLQTDYPSRFI